MYPNKVARIRTLVEIGLLPEIAQAIVEEANQVDDLLTDVQMDALAFVTDLDHERARTFVLYSAIVPERIRRMFDALSV